MKSRNLIDDSRFSLTAYALLQEKEGYPPDHRVVVIEEDGRMETDGWDIR